jgi:hypothetical protein
MSVEVPRHALSNKEQPEQEHTRATPETTTTTTTTPQCV